MRSAPVQGTVEIEEKNGNGETWLKDQHRNRRASAIQHPAPPCADAFGAPVDAQSPALRRIGNGDYRVSHICVHG